MVPTSLQYLKSLSHYTPVPVIIDGSATNSCWQNAQWHAIEQVWIPYGATMESGDFEGKYKVAWDSNYLYLLVQVVDDSLADYYTDPLSNWWNDDCVEIFIDEDRSKGYHECSYNAFAYHVSIYYDAIDMSTSCAGINLRNNIHVVMDTIDSHTYLWEFAIKIYNQSFNPSNPELSRVKLTPNKHMGFAVAYCDYDGNAKHERENFIGSIFMPANHNNDNYRTADYLGEMILVDSLNQWTKPVGISNIQSYNHLFEYHHSTHKLIVGTKIGNSAILRIFAPNGQMVYYSHIAPENTQISLPHMPAGLYLVQLFDGKTQQMGKLVIRE